MSAPALAEPSKDVGADPVRAQDRPVLSTPRRRRVIGDIRDFQADILAALRRGWREQGDLARYRLGPLAVVGISSPELAEKILTDSATYAKLGRDNPLRLALGDGLLTNSDHPDWLRKRRMVQPAYHRKSMEHMFRSMQDCTVELADRWQRPARRRRARPACPDDARDAGHRQPGDVQPADADRFRAQPEGRGRGHQLHVLPAAEPARAADVAADPAQPAFSSR